jgi:hypothetical protein
MNNYTPEQLADIKTRQEAVIAFVEKQEIAVMSRIAKVPLEGKIDLFVDKVEIILVDTKYAPKEDNVVAEKVNE